MYTIYKRKWFVSVLVLLVVNDNGVLWLRGSRSAFQRDADRQEHPLPQPHRATGHFGMTEFDICSGHWSCV